MSLFKSSKQKVVILSVVLVLLAVIGVAITRRPPSAPLSAADVKYREVIERSIREGKREFSAPTAVRVQIIVQAAKQAGFKFTTEPNGEGARVYLSRP
jgi:hypothetical protein